MKRTHSTEHARYNKDCSTSYTDLTLNEARIKRRPAVVHTMLQYSSLCAINMYSSCMIPVRNLQNQNVHYSSDALVFTYSKSTYMHIIRTCSIGRSYVGYYYTDLFVQSSLQFYMIPVFRTRTLQQQSNSSSSSRLRPRGTQGGGRYMLRKVWIRPSYVACVCFAVILLPVIPAQSAIVSYERRTTDQHYERGNSISKAAL